MNAMCWKCAEDEYLAKIIKAEGSRLKCSLCETNRKAFDVEELAAIVDPIMQAHFYVGESVRRPSEDDHDEWEQEGDPLDRHLFTRSNWTISRIRRRNYR